MDLQDATDAEQDDIHGHGEFGQRLEKASHPKAVAKAGLPGGESTIALPGTQFALPLAQGPQHELISDREVGRPVGA